MSEISVNLQGRAGICYRDGEKQITIDSELLATSDADIVIYLDSISRWDPPFDGIALTSGDIDEIKHNLSKGLNNMRIDWQ